MATTSSVPTFKAALAAQIQAVLPDLQVEYSMPGDIMERETLYLGDINGAFEIPTMKAGRKTRNENYALAVIIDVVIPGGLAQDAELQAFNYAAKLEDILANNPGAQGVTSAVAGPFSSQTFLDVDGAACRLVMTIDVTNRLN